MTSQTQTGGLLMNKKKERSAHKGGRGGKKCMGQRGLGGQNKNKTEKRKENREPFCPRRMDEVILQVRPPRGIDL